MDDRKKSPRGRRMSPNKSPVKVIQTEEQCKSGKRTVGQRQRQEVKWAKTSHIYWIYFCLLITSFLHPVITLSTPWQTMFQFLKCMWKTEERRHSCIHLQSVLHWIPGVYKIGVTHNWNRQSMMEGGLFILLLLCIQK